MKKGINHALYFIVSLVLLSACNTDEELTPNEISQRQDQIIQEFLDDNQLVAEKTSSGMYFLVVTPNTGAPKPLYGDTVVVNVTSMELGSRTTPYEYGTAYGEIYQSTYFNAEPVEVTVGQIYNAPIGITVGWREALEMMEVGSRKVFFMPSEIGYGRNGYPPFVGAYSVVVFDIELLEIRPAF